MDGIEAGGKDPDQREGVMLTFWEIGLLLAIMIAFYLGSFWYGYSCGYKHGKNHGREDAINKALAQLSGRL